MRQFVGYKDEVVGTVDAEIARRGQEFGDDLKPFVPAHAPDFSGCEIGHVHVAPAVEIYSAKILKTVGKEPVGEELYRKFFTYAKNSFDFRSYTIKDYIKEKNLDSLLKN